MAGAARRAAPPSPIKRESTMKAAVVRHFTQPLSIEDV